MPPEEVPPAVDGPLTMNVTLVIQPEHREQYLSELREVLPQARAEDASVYLLVGEVVDQPGTFVLSECWRNADEYVNEILRRPYFQRYVEHTEPLYASPRTVLVLAPVAWMEPTTRMD